MRVLKALLALALVVSLVGAAGFAVGLVVHHHDPQTVASAQDVPAGQPSASPTPPSPSMPTTPSSDPRATSPPATCCVQERRARRCASSSSASPAGVAARDHDRRVRRGDRCGGARLPGQARAAPDRSAGPSYVAAARGLDPAADPRRAVQRPPPGPALLGPGDHGSDVRALQARLRADRLVLRRRHRQLRRRHRHRGPRLPGASGGSRSPARSTSARWTGWSR